MNPQRRCCAIGLALLALPGLAWGHDIVPWGTYPTSGGVRISTKVKTLQHTTFISTMAVMPSLPGDVWAANVGANLPQLGGAIEFMGSPATARLKAAAGVTDNWVGTVTPLLRAYLESRGDTVQQLDVALAKWQGTAKFKTKPTPVGPLHKVKATINMTMQVTATMASGRTKRGNVRVAITISGVRPGIPGMD